MLEELLIASAAKMGLTISKAQCAQLERYRDMLERANAQFNLTRIPADDQEFIDRNVLDCISPLCSERWQNVRYAADVGSGAGFPGIPLAIMRPNVRFVLMEALDKRVKFLQAVIDELSLNAEAVHGRAEVFGQDGVYREQFDLAVSRAVAPVNILCEFLLPLVKPDGWMLALKGPGAQEELNQAEGAIALLGGDRTFIEPVCIPERDWRHCLLWTHKGAQTPQGYPRRAAIPEKRPLSAPKSSASPR